MNVMEILENLFKNQVINDYRGKLSQIKDRISSQEDIFKIVPYDLDLDDILKRKNDPSYLDNDGIEYIDGGIKILVPIKEFWNDIKYYIPKSVTKLEMPFYMVEYDLSYLKNFPNLKEITFNDYWWSFEKEDYQKIYDATNVRNIQIRSASFSEKFAEYQEFYVSGFPYNALCYKNMRVSPMEKKEETEEDKQRVYNSFDSITINVYDLNKDNIECLFNDNTRVKEITINCKNNEYKIVRNDKNIIENIDIKSDEFYDAVKFYDYLINKGYTVKQIKIDVRNIDYTKIDLSRYEELANNTNLLFNYSSYMVAPFNEFKGLLESIKWFRNIMIDDLSPVEKLMFAFDIAKTFSYNESQTTKNISREPDKIIETGNIVCVGYCEMLKEILKNIDGITIGSFGVTCDNSGGHERNMVQVDDDKYNIHGIFALDATWDCFKENGIEVLGKDYTALSLYRYFLVPKDSYKSIFPNDSIPDMFSKPSELLQNNILTKEYSYIFKGDSSLENNITNEEIMNYLNVKRPSLETFNQILYNVRIAEGYPHEEALKEVERVNTINEYLINMMNNSGNNITFFEKEAKK